MNPGVTGFAGMDWGATVERIKEARGEPLATARQPEGVQVLTYGDRLMGETVVALFFVHPRHGFFRGGYHAETPTVEKCREVLNRFGNAVADRYPTLRFEERRGGDQGQEACAGAAAGTTAYGASWTDVIGGARILMTVTPGTPGVMLTFTTPDADAWERRKNGGG